MLIMKKLIAFDLDGTLSDSKVTIKPEMAGLLRQLLRKLQVCVISGQGFDQFQKQLIKPLRATEVELSHLHILPTNGTHYYRYDLDSNMWQKIYAQEIPQDQRQKISAAIEATAKELGYWEAKTWGEHIEDRGSQVTFSALGQKAPLELKKGWDPDGNKRQRMYEALSNDLPGFAVHSAGLTSIDITEAGLDKATALTKLKDVLGLHESEMLYVGDSLAPGGNDAVVKKAGIETVAVSGPDDTAKEIQKLLA